MGANSSRARYEYGYGDSAYGPYGRTRKREMAAGNPYYRQPGGMIPAGYPVMQPPIAYPMVIQQPLQPLQQVAGQPMMGQFQPGAVGVPVMPPNQMPIPQMTQFQGQPMAQPQPQLPLSTGHQFVQQQGAGAANPAAFMPRYLSRMSSTSSSDYDSRERRRRRRRRRRSWERDPMERNPLPAAPRESDIPDEMLAGTAMVPRGPPLPRPSSPLRNPLPPPPKDVYTLRKYRKLLIGSDYADMEKEVYPRGWFSDDEERDSDSGLGRVFERLNPFRQRGSGFSPGHRRHETMPELPRLPEIERERSGYMSESTDVSPPMRRPGLGRSFSSRLPFMRRRRRGEGVMPPPMDHSLPRVAEGPEPPVGFMAHSPAVPGPTSQPQPAHPFSPMTSGPQPAQPFSPDPPEPQPMAPNPNPSGMPEPVIPTNQSGMPVPGHPLTPGPPHPTHMLSRSPGPPPQPANPLTPGPPPAHPLTSGPPPMGMPTPGMSQSMSMPMPGVPRSMGMPEPGGPPPMGMPSPAMPQGMPMPAHGGPPPLGMPTPGAQQPMSMPTPRGSQPMSMPEPGFSQTMGMPTPGPTAARPLSPFIPPLRAGEGPAFSRSRSGSNSDATLPVIYFDQTTPGYGGLCHQSPHRVLYRKKLYPTAAHLFEAFRFLGWRDDLASRVRKAQTFPELNEVLHSIEQYTRSDWEVILLDKMEEALYCKIAQHDELRNLLLDTGDAELIYADPNDMVWGEGEDGEGANELGRILMRVRDRLRREAIGHL